MGLPIELKTIRCTATRGTGRRCGVPCPDSVSAPRRCASAWSVQSTHQPHHNRPPNCYNVTMENGRGIIPPVLPPVLEKVNSPMIGMFCFYDAPFPAPEGYPELGAARPPSTPPHWAAGASYVSQWWLGIYAPGAQSSGGAIASPVSSSRHLPPAPAKGKRLLLHVSYLA